MFELRSARAFATLPDELAAVAADSRRCARSIVALLSEIDERFHDFSDLDSRFHRLINSAAPNRFIDGFYDIITLIFHYHYQWNKQDERQRNEVAIREHLTYIDALLSRSRTMVELACRAHLASARGDTDAFDVGEEPAISSRARVKLRLVPDNGRDRSAAVLLALCEGCCAALLAEASSTWPNRGN